MTTGERIVRTDFYKTDQIRDIKRQFALLLDKMEDVVKMSYLQGEAHGTEEYYKKVEAGRAAKVAMDYLETAGMYAVKALTV